MSLVYLSYRAKPWKFTWKDPGTGGRRCRSFVDEAEARAFEAAQNVMAEREKELLQRARQRRKAQDTTRNITINELLDMYFTMHCTHPVTQQSCLYHARSLRMFLGTRRAASLSVQDMQAYFEAQQLRGVGATTIHRRAAILRAALNWAVRMGKMGSNPLSRLRLPSARSRRISPPTPQEARAIMDNAAPHIRRVIVLGLYTGARIGPSELYRLRWADVDLTAGVVRMPSAAKSDGPDGRDVPLRADILPMLAEWQAEDAAQGCPWVIHYRGQSVRRLNHGWKLALERAGITRRIRMYDLRHAFATYALAGGADIASVAEIMAHKNATMILRTYQHVLDTQKRAAVEALPALMPL